MCSFGSRGRLGLFLGLESEHRENGGVPFGHNLMAYLAAGVVFRPFRDVLLPNRLRAAMLANEVTPRIKTLSLCHGSEYGTAESRVNPAYFQTDPPPDFRAFPEGFPPVQPDHAEPHRRPADRSSGNLQMGRDRCGDRELADRLQCH